MDAGEGDWSWTVSKAIKNPVQRPRLDFVVSSWAYAGHRFALDDLAKPVIEAVSRNARSAWISATRGDRPGVRVADTSPPFPPRIDRTIELSVPPTRDNASALKAELSRQPVMRGELPVGVHIDVGSADPGNFGFGGAPRLVLDALSETLGGDLSNPGDLRIRDLRVVRGGARSTGTEIRIWVLDP